MKTDAFALRHIGPRETDLQHMFKTIGVSNMEQLIYETLPDDIRLKYDLNLEPAMTEYEFAKHIFTLGNKNKVFQSYIGLGYNQAIIPAVIQRNVFENPGWYTAYTPYQAEIAQGRLEAILNFQTMVIELSGMAGSKFKSYFQRWLFLGILQLQMGRSFGCRCVCLFSGKRNF